MISFVIATSCLSLVFAIFLARYVIQRDTGTQKMQDISNAIKEGAEAFLSRQNRTIITLSAILAALIFILYAYVRTPSPADPVRPVEMAFWTTLSFVLGAACSVVAGYIGMWGSIRANIRTASAVRSSLNDGLQIAMRGGAVSGLFVVAMSLLGVGGLYALLEALGHDPQKIPFTIVGYGFGASFVALFAQLGGGIYTKAADVGADLVGKVEAGIPEDDPRNPAVIADLVGDNVGDCAGRGADLFESTAAENIGAMILGVAAFLAARQAGLPHPEVWVLFPLVVRAFGLFATMGGVLCVRSQSSRDPMKSLNLGYYISVALSVIGLAVATFVMLREVTANPWWLFLACVVGIATSIAFVYITQWYTETKYRPVRGIANASRTGPATNIVAGTAVGFETTASTAIVIGVAILLSYWLGSQATMPDGTPLPSGGLFGTAVATMGMLMTAAYILAMDTFGPITDNAAGIVEMSGSSAQVRNVTDSLDAVGNTTKALTKGYAMGSAGLAAFLLFNAYLDEIANVLGVEFDTVNLATPEVFVAGLLGVMLAFLFSSLAIRAVGKAAGDIIEEVRRQFRERPGIMAGTEAPDYARCVDITTRAGLREMVVPGILAVAMPVVLGLVMRFLFGNGAAAVASFLMVGTIGGIILATFLNKSGGAWDNAKKLIEAGGLHNPTSGEDLGKGSPTHAAAVVGDTVGDPFKDTAGPSLHVLVKLLATVTLVMAPLFV